MLSRLRLVHRFMIDKYGYMILSVLLGLWIMAHYNVYNWGLPLTTDDRGVPLYHK